MFVRSHDNDSGERCRAVLPNDETPQTATLAGRPDDPVLRSYVLAELRRAALRARLASPTSMPSVLRLKPGLIGPQDAVEALADAGALEYLEATPTNTGSAS